MNKLHVPLGDAYEIQTWDELHDKWIVWSFATSWGEAEKLSDHARDHCHIAKGKVRIVKV